MVDESPVIAACGVGVRHTSIFFLAVVGRAGQRHKKNACSSHDGQAVPFTDNQRLRAVITAPLHQFGSAVVVHAPLGSVSRFFDKGDC